MTKTRAYKENDERTGEEDKEKGGKARYTADSFVISYVLVHDK